MLASEENYCWQVVVYTLYKRVVVRSLFLVSSVRQSHLCILVDKACCNTVPCKPKAGIKTGIHKLARDTVLCGPDVLLRTFVLSVLLCSLITVMKLA